MEFVSRLSPAANAALKRSLENPVVEVGPAIEPPDIGVQVTIGAPPNPSTTPMYLPPLLPLDERLARWFIGQLFTPQRTLRFLRWFPWTYLAVRGFLRAWSWGRSVSQGEFIKRMKACEECPARQVRIVPLKVKGKVTGWTEKNYCGRCGCPEWKLSELHRKNKMVGWKCPLRRHEGEYGDETYRHLLGKGGGCTSCGGG